MTEAGAFQRGKFLPLGSTYLSYNMVGEVTNGEETKPVR